VLGLKLIDLAVIVGYFAVVIAIGFRASFLVKTEEDYFLGGRRFGKGLLVMHWLCTGTHSEMAVQVAGASARVGLGGIWYQWMWLFSTPFYWMIAPMIRRLRVVTTADFFRLRYGRSLELAYSLVALIFIVLSIAMLLRGASAAIAGATGGAVPTNACVIALAVLFSTYVMAGGLMAAAWTDYLQGVMIIVLSIMLVPAGLSAVGGMSALYQTLGPEMLAITAPEGAVEGDALFVVAMSILGLVGIVAQPHVMTANGSGKTETESRVGMTYGNFIKRLLTIAWALTGLIAIAMFPEVAREIESLDSESAKHLSETLYGRAIQSLLGDGWRGLMIACLIAGVTSAETIMVVGSGIVSRNLHHWKTAGARQETRLWFGRGASALILLAGILAALYAGSVTQLYLWSMQVIGLMGPAVWLGTTWRRANPAGAWSGLMAGLAIWSGQSLLDDPKRVAALHESLAAFAPAQQWLADLAAMGRAQEILLVLGVQLAATVAVCLITRPQDKARLDAFFARLLTPVGQEAAVAHSAAPTGLDASADLGMEGTVLDYGKASPRGWKFAARLGVEIPSMSGGDWGGFLAAWAAVGGLILLLIWLSGLGRP
jgi:Na+/proline symporter